MSDARFGIIRSKIDHRLTTEANMSGSAQFVAAPIFKGYIPNVRFRSTLLANPQALHSSTIPPTDDLVALQEELRDIKHRTLERIKKSESDLKLFKTKWDAAKEREKNRDALARERTKNKKDLLYNKIKREPSGMLVPYESLTF
jgi:hypothetical protein